MEYYDFDGEPITLKEWAKLFASPDRIFGKTEVNGHDVSTVWLGINHSYGGGPPLIFETMVFCKHGEDGCGWDEFCERYSTKEQALRGHACTCNNVTGPKGGK